MQGRLPHEGVERPASLGVTVWREASGDNFAQLSVGSNDHIACNICGATPVSGEASD